MPSRPERKEEIAPEIAVRTSGDTSAGYTKEVRQPLLILLVVLIIVSLLLPMVAFFGQ